MSEQLEEYVGETVLVVTNDGRILVGTLRGYDRQTNVILAKCVERVFDADAGIEEDPVGLYVVKGNNVAAVGLIDVEKDSAIDLSRVSAAPLKEITH